MITTFRGFKYVIGESERKCINTHRIPVILIHENVKEYNVRILERI